MRKQDQLTDILPDGTVFDFWEKECVFDRTLYVSCDDPNSSDENDGSRENPFKTINRAAAEA